MSVSHFSVANIQIIFSVTNQLLKICIATTNFITNFDYFPMKSKPV